MALELRDYLLTDAGVAVAGWTVNLRTGRKTGAPGAILFTTSTDVNGMWEFVDGSGGVTLVGGTKYDVQAVSGSSERWWRGYTAIPQEFTNLQIAATADIVLTKLDEGTIDDTVDPATTPATLQARLSQFAALLKRLSGGSTFTASPLRGPANSLVNGDFIVWQRGTSFAAIATAAYGPDRWQWSTVGTGAVSILRSTDVPTVGTNAINTVYSCQVDVTTADAAIAAGDVYTLMQSVEGYDYRALTNGFALSFWVKAAKTGIHCVSFRNQVNDRSYVAEYTVSVADTWEYKTVVVTTPPTAGTWNYESGIGLSVGFALAAGSTFQTTAGAWQTGNFMATASQVNELDNTANNFRVALVNLIPGSTAAPLVPLPYQQQLARCMRYAQQLGNSVSQDRLGIGMNVSTTEFGVFIPLRVPMRGAPTATFSAASTFSGVTNAIAVQALSTIILLVASPTTVTLLCTMTTLTAGQANQLLDSAGSASILLVSNPG